MIQWDALFIYNIMYWQEKLEDVSAWEFVRKYGVENMRTKNRKNDTR